MAARQPTGDAKTGHSGPGSSCVSEVPGDLFTCPSEASLAHCVSRCLAMGKGIATQFKRRFGQVDQLKAQGAAIGGVAVLQHEVVTKERYFHKPTYDSLRSSLEACRSHCVAHGVRHLCMPRIGAGLDKLKWHRVKAMLEEVFTGTGVKITVYYI